MVSSDIKVLDCKTNVAPMPNSKPLTGVAVQRDIMRSSVPPAALCKPSSMHCMPTETMPNHSTVATTHGFAKMKMPTPTKQALAGAV